MPGRCHRLVPGHTDRWDSSVPARARQWWGWQLRFGSCSVPFCVGPSRAAASGAWLTLGAHTWDGQVQIRGAGLRQTEDSCSFADIQWVRTPVRGGRDQSRCSGKVPATSSALPWATVTHTIGALGYNNYKLVSCTNTEELALSPPPLDAVCFFMK